MRAMVMDDREGEARLVMRDVPEPEVGPADLLVEVKFAGLNRVDTHHSRNHALRGPHGIGGNEMAGNVVKVGSQCLGFAVGDRVMALTTACFAERVSVDHRLAVPLGSGMDFAAAASLPAWFMTAHNALRTEGQLARGEIVLVQGATSGIGIAAVQLARHIGASRVIGVARSVGKLEQLLNLGLDVALSADDNWPEAVRSSTGGAGADLTIDLVGAGALDGHLRAAALRARIVAIGRLGGSADQLDLNLFSLKRLRLIGVSFRSRAVEEKAEIAAGFAKDIIPAVEDGKLRPVIDRIFPMVEAAAAQDYVKRNAHFGKVLIKVGE